MKLLTLVAALLITSASYAASDSKLCKLLPSSTSEGEVTELYSKNFWDKPSFNKWEQKQVVAFFNHDQNVAYFDHNGNEVNLKKFEEIFNHFSDKRTYEELHLSVMKDMKTGHVYTYVWSYPGDNEYGVYIDPQGTIVAEIQDGDLVVDGDYCPWN